MFVVDTNVPKAANGGDKINVDADCQEACVDRLESLVCSEIITIDKGGLILDEYSNHFSFSGKPGIGDMFFKYLFDNQYNHNRINQVEIHESDDEHIGFEELPKNKLDPSDRKFLAVAVKAEAIIINATDSDWMEQHSLMKKLGVEVCQLCPEYAAK